MATTNQAPIGSRWKFKADNTARTWVVTARHPGGVVEYRQEGRSVFGSSFLRDWLRNADRIDAQASGAAS